MGVSLGRASSTSIAWAKWTAFVNDLGLDPFLQAFPDKVAHQVHTGELAAGGSPVRSRTAEDYVRHVAQTFLLVGAHDHRLNSAHAIDFRIQQTLKAWKTTDSAPDRVKPIPIPVICRIAFLAQSASSTNATF